jgi:hypothetical protein
MMMKKSTLSIVQCLGNGVINTKCNNNNSHHPAQDNQLLLHHPKASLNVLPMKS